MAVVDPFISLRDWRTSLHRGDPAVIDQFLAGIDTTLLPGWVRDREYERPLAAGPHPLLRVRPDREMRRCGCGSSG